MSSIRIRFHYNTVTLNESGVVDGHKSICGSTVEVFGRDGSTERFDFNGFRQYQDYRDSLIPVQFVKIWNVAAYYADDFARPEFIDSGYYCIGVYEANERAVYLLLDEDKLMTRKLDRPLDGRKEKHRNLNNVVPIRSA
ncbi:hypothetical protein [Vibrio barjaei]|uniref:hypothetical protein n=1 Tax=Vibrio barjaei TaxID=1676683 RepID=UPI0022843944|nr:hypothetical protein [Vibrio barjaei]MCY9873010.1 hypothetical protein [Vibrio barjaei]